MSTAALFTIAKIWRQPKCLSTKWMDTEDVVLYICVCVCVCEILLSRKKEWLLEICSKMDGLGGYYAQWNKSDKDKYCVISLLLLLLLQPTRLPRPWDSPGKNTGVGCRFLLQSMKVKNESEVAQLCLTPSDSMDCSLPGSSVHGICQARVLEWISLTRGT